jgi:putative two-component system response regulator
MSKAEKPYVLVVDDNSETCTLISAVLRRDFTCEIASDGMEAIDKLRTKRYAVVLLDLRMPQYDGFGVLEFLKDSQPETLHRVIVVTATLGERDLTRARSYGVTKIVAKPFDVDLLLNTVKERAEGEGPKLGGVFCTPVIMLLADLLHRKLL